jgi:hypothetical protein
MESLFFFICSSSFTGLFYLTITLVLFTKNRKNENYREGEMEDRFIVPTVGKLGQRDRLKVPLR